MDPLSVSKPELKALYEKAGGEAGIHAILQDFYKRMSQDILLSFFFTGKDLSRIIEMQKQFLMRAMGATPSYSGKPPAQAHENLAPILTGHFNRRLRILEETLRSHGLSDEDIRTWVSFENAFRPGVVKDGRKLVGLAILCSAAFLGRAPFTYADPVWYQHQKQVEKQKEEEKEEQDQEKPIVGPDSPVTDPNAVMQLSAATKPPEQTNLLFKSAGLTDSFHLLYGSLNQTGVNGGTLGLQFGMGWWWQPHIILGFFGQSNVVVGNTYFFTMLSVGPQIKVFLKNRWLLTGDVGYAYSQGLITVPTAHIPPPPDAGVIGARQGMMFDASAAYLVWLKHSFGLGPIFSYSTGWQSERGFSVISVGILIQDGRPNYSGDLTN